MILIRLFLCFLTPTFAGSFDDAIQFIEKTRNSIAFKRKGQVSAFSRLYRWVLG